MKRNDKEHLVIAKAGGDRETEGLFLRKSEGNYSPKATQSTPPTAVCTPRPRSSGAQPSPQAVVLSSPGFLLPNCVSLARLLNLSVPLLPQL